MSEQGLNRCEFLGRLGADAESRSTKSGDTVLNFRLACSESYLDRNKVRQDRTEWIPCSMFGKRAAALAQYLTKGTQVWVEGRFSTRSWEKDGAKQYKTEITVTDVKLLGGKRDGGQRTARDEGPAEDAGTGCGVGEDDFDDGSIPF